MIDFPILSLILMFAFIGMVIVFRVFKWGHDKEPRGERTDFLGRPNNHMPGRMTDNHVGMKEEEMD